MKLRTAILTLAVSMAFAGAAAAAGNAAPAPGDAAPPPAAPMMSKDAIVASLKGAGYTKVHDVELEDGVWEAKAVDSTGHKVELKLDPTDGHVLVPGQARATKEATEDAAEHAEDANEHAEDANEDAKDDANEEHHEDTEEHH